MNGAEKLNIRDTDDGAVISVKVVAGSSRDRVVGVLGEHLKVATAVAAEKGRANAAVAETLAKALGVDKRSVELVSGRTNPHKEFRVAAMPAAKVRQLLRDAR